MSATPSTAACRYRNPTGAPELTPSKPDSRRSRHGILQRAEDEGYVIAAGHFHPEQHIGKVIRSNGRRLWQAL